MISAEMFVARTTLRPFCRPSSFACDDAGLPPRALAAHQGRVLPESAAVIDAVARRLEDAVRSAQEPVEHDAAAFAA